MTIRRIVTALLILFVGVSAVYLIAGERRTRILKTESRRDSSGASTTTGNPAARPEKSPDSAAHQVVAYYFHGNYRCPTCRAIEAYAEETLRSGFAAELQSGKLVWLVVNLETPGNEHYINDYQLTTRSVVLVEMENGNEIQWRRLDKVWQLVHNKDAFASYISENTKALLAGI